MRPRGEGFCFREKKKEPLWSWRGRKGGRWLTFPKKGRKKKRRAAFSGGRRKTQGNLERKTTKAGSVRGTKGKRNASASKKEGPIEKKKKKRLFVHAESEERKGQSHPTNEEKAS